MSKSNDYIVRATAGGGYIRAFAATTRDMVETARSSHDTYPVVTAALGRLLTAGAMMGRMLKGDKDKLTLQIRGDGPVGGLTVTADSHGAVKGYAINPVVAIPAKPNGKLDVSGAIGRGGLTVIRDMGLKEPYNGFVELVSGEIADDLTYYFNASEQTPSSVGLGVLMSLDNTVDCAGGFIIQLLPMAPDDVIDKLEENLKTITSVTDMLKSGKTPEDILAIILDGMDMEILERYDCAFKCECDRKRLEKVLISVGRAELTGMIEDGETIEVKCNFCNKAYNFTVPELIKLRDSI